jgi:DNA-binding transcriptional MocR family regulator
MVMLDTTDPELIQLGATVPDPDILPVDRLNRMLYSQVRTHKRASVSYALETATVNACLVIPNFSNPIGGVMSDERKAQLVKFLDSSGIPLIEDDINCDLSHTDERPIPVKSFDRTGNVLLCSSFTKTIAPGYRVGYIAAGRFLARGGFTLWVEMPEEVDSPLSAGSAID